MELVDAQESISSGVEASSSKATAIQQHQRQSSVPLASTSLSEPRRYPPLSTPRRATRNSALAASNEDEDQVVKDEEMGGENSVKASVDTWITTSDKEWTLVPPQIDVDLVQILPSDFTPLPWMHLTRHPIAWDGITDAG